MHIQNSLDMEWRCKISIISLNTNESGFGFTFLER